MHPDFDHFFTYVNTQIPHLLTCVFCDEDAEVIESYITSAGRSLQTCLDLQSTLIVTLSKRLKSMHSTPLNGIEIATQNYYLYMHSLNDTHTLLTCTQYPHTLNNPLWQKITKQAHVLI